MLNTVYYNSKWTRTSEKEIKKIKGTKAKIHRIRGSFLKLKKKNRKKQQKMNSFYRRENCTKFFCKDYQTTIET